VKLGILTAPFSDSSLADVASWSASVGFEALEIACWPSASGEKRRYAGTSHIAVEEMSKSRADDVAGSIAAKGLSISGLGYYPNPLHPDAAHRETVIAHLKKVIRAAGLMKVKVVNTFVGGNRALTADQNWENAVPVFNEIVAHSKDNGVTLAFENCPMIFSQDEWPGGHNIAYAPKIWRRIFETWGDAVGINYDPSHLVWQMIDNARFIREFGGRFVHVHAKDMMIDQDGLYENGIMSLGMGWQVPRMPGLGEVKWAEVFAGLYRAGYDGPVIIEHEDKNFEGSDEKIKRGFLLAKDVLRPFVK
jgi:sugar phosphate isomerase/epimerase